MAIEVVLPMLGITVEKGRILKWHKQEGDRVLKGEILFEVETEKVVTEVESPATGILGRILVGEDVEVPLLTVVALILEEGEELPKADQKVAPPASKSHEKVAAPMPVSSLGKVKPWDLAVLGGGPAGYAAAIRAAQKGANVLLVEREKLGGTCLHKGCIPTKCFLSDVDLFQKVKSSDLFQGSSALKLEIPKMGARKDKVVRGLHSGLERLLQTLGVEVSKGLGEILGPNKILLKADGEEQIQEAGSLLIATGSSPSCLPNLKPDGRLILHSDHLLEMGEVPQRLAVIGGGAVGLEWAQIMRGLGAQVTVLEMLPRLFPVADEDLGGALHRALENQGIRVLTEAVVEQARPQGREVEVFYRFRGERFRIEVDQVLLAAGRTPNTDGLGLERIGIVRERGFIKTDDRMCTSLPGIYAAGDVTGRAMLAHAAFGEADVAVKNIFGEPARMDYRGMPYCVYTSPEAAWAGLSETQARQAGYVVKAARFPLGHNGKALALGEGEGFVKLVGDEELGQILGVSIVGPHATELLGECLLAMRIEASMEELGQTLKPHPTLSEAVAEAAMEFMGIPLHAPQRSNR